MNNKIMITQPMFFPWLGFFEQIQYANKVILYDDVQYSKGSFTNRVQFKTEKGIKWLTVPLKNLKLGQKINEVQINNTKNWKRSHIDFLKNTYSKHLYKDIMIKLIEEVYENKYTTINELSEMSILRIIDFLNLEIEYYRSSELNIKYSNSKRVFEIVKYFNGHEYITAHGAKNYLHHELFEQNDIEVKYMDYLLQEYPQKNGPFTPYVSILDLIANTGLNSTDYLNPKTKNWKEFLNERN